MDDRKKRKGESGLRYAARMARDTRKPKKPPEARIALPNEATCKVHHGTAMPCPHCEASSDREWKCPGCGWKFTTSHCPDCGIERTYAEAEAKREAGATDEVGGITAPVAMRESTCTRLGCNIYGRVRHALDLAEKGEDAKAATELREVISFLGNGGMQVVDARRPDQTSAYWATGEADVLGEPEYRKSDDERAASVLDRLAECAEGGSNAVILDISEASDVVQMLRSQSTLARIAALSKEGA